MMSFKEIKKMQYQMINRQTQRCINNELLLASKMIMSDFPKLMDNNPSITSEDICMLYINFNSSKDKLHNNKKPTKIKEVLSHEDFSDLYKEFCNQHEKINNKIPNIP